MNATDYKTQLKPLLHVWNGLYYRLDRIPQMKHIIRQRHTVNPLGKGNKAWKRAERLDIGAFHIAGGIYVK